VGIFQVKIPAQELLTHAPVTIPQSLHSRSVACILRHNFKPPADPNAGLKHVVRLHKELTPNFKVGWFLL
jgi:hypothetical protein